MQKKQSRAKSAILYILVVVGVILATSYLFKIPTATPPKYSEIVDLFYNNAVTEYKLNLGSGKMTLTVKSDEIPAKYFEDKIAKKLASDATKATISYTVPNV